MITRIFNTIITLLFLISCLLPLSTVQAESTSDIYDKQVKKYAKVEQVVFRDDPTDVGGKAYDFAKASLGWLGIPSQALDVADFGRNIYNDGLTGGNALTLVAKMAASKVSSKKLAGYLGRMNNSQLKNLAGKLPITVGKEGDIQKAILELVTETGTKSASSSIDGRQSEALEIILIDVVTKACPPCDTAHKGYELAREAAKAADIAFDNTKTQAMFNKITIAGFNDFKAFQEEFVGGDGLKAGARKVLTLYNDSRGGSAPTDDQVMRFIFKRYQQWRKEIKMRQDEAVILEQVKENYLKLLKFQKEEMFGPGNEAQWTAKFMSKYIALYNQVVAQRGKNGLWNRSNVRWHVFQLLKRQLRDGLTDEEVRYEQKKLAVKWEWIDKSELGNPPKNHTLTGKKTSLPPKLKDCKQEKTPKERRRCIVLNRLLSINHTKLLDTLKNLDLEPGDSFYNCLCYHAGYGSPQTHQYYHPGIIGEFDARYSCQQPGDPCVVAGYGCGRHPLPAKQSVWDTCMESNPIGRKKDRDGNVIMRTDRDGKVILDEQGNPVPTGQRLDDAIIKKLRERHRKKNL